MKHDLVDSLQDKSRVKSLKRALRLLRAFDLKTPELGVSELNRRLALPKSAVFRLLSTLQDSGFVEQNPATRNYRLGRAIFELAGIYANHNELIRLCEPFLRDLVAQTGYTAQLGVSDGLTSVSLVVVESPLRVRVVLRPGERTEIHATATGKVILAGLSDEELRALLPAGPLPALTPKTITSVDALMRELDRVRRQGYAMNLAEYNEGDYAVAAPVRDFRGRVLAGVSLSWPTHMVTDAQVHDLVERVTQTAADMSCRLGAPDREPSIAFQPAHSMT